MCDYSLHHVKTRPAKVGDQLITHRFGSRTTGFSAPEDIGVAVCVLPGTGCRLPTTLNGRACDRGAEISSPTRSLFSAKLIKTARKFTTTPWNFLTARSCC
jgi:hypothetical protein